MNRIKHLVFHSYNSLILLLISLLGFTTSCAKEEIKYMYGSPNAKFIVKGEIKSAQTQQPIPDIIVEMRIVYEQEGGARLAGTSFSRANGDYEVAMGDSPGDYTIQLKYTDTDGPLNGEYETKDTTVVFKDTKYTGGDGSWYWGYAEKEMDIKLKPKE
jgi:putative lipoprotein (rSAM/lipoprotein system)